MTSFRKLLAIMALLSSTVLAQSQDPGPSPTASTGCEPHGDHWHCDGPVSMTTSASLGSSTASDFDVLTTSDGTSTISSKTSVTPTMPSPTESVGCEPHNDHWHCDGPRETSSSSLRASATASASASAVTDDAENGVSGMGVEMLLLAGLSIVAAGLNV
ncbi:uncharacterized protein N7511_002343 [Penicillium nucicola]|uniref:uncharacterized protein n=1 Tax=Penicillium nucicola TaxID=1850975 RepID=UPI002544DC68|nr:uncharacterized protein N7511_002343 [Penicillium nucicola]KAJ5770292.1 hypothetical protein N7511_002343 [Penicillium nucicola]